MASLAAGKEKTPSQKNAIKEALKIIKEADACLKTSMFNWKKDYLSAAPLYAKASNHYRMGKEPQKAIDCLVKAATCAAECGQEFEVGKHNQQAGMIAKTMKTEEYFKMAADFFEQAFNAYKDNGDMVTAQTAGKQAADIIAKFDVDRAVAMYVRIIDALEALEQWAYTFQLYRDVTRMALRDQDYGMVLTLIQRAIKAFTKGNQTNTVYQWLLSETILMVYREDIIGADEAFLEALGYGRYGLSDQGEAAEDFLKGVKENNAEKLKAVKNLPGMKFLPVPEIGRLANEVMDKIIGNAPQSDPKKTTMPAAMRDTQRKKSPMDLSSIQKSLQNTSKSIANSLDNNNNTNIVNDDEEKINDTVARTSTASATLENSIAETNDLLNGFEDDFDDLA